MLALLSDRQRKLLNMMQVIASNFNFYCLANNRADKSGSIFLWLAGNLAFMEIGRNSVQRRMSNQESAAVNSATCDEEMCRLI